MRELRRAAEPAVLGIEALLERADRLERRLGRESVVGAPRRPGACAASAAASASFCARDVGAVLAVVRARRARSSSRERRHAVARRSSGSRCRRRTACCSGVRNIVSGQPPPRCVEHLVRGLVDLVEVGPLLAVDLDVDEEAVHHLRDLGILERLVRHHVAPVAGRVADREQDRLVLGARARERLLAPRVPVDRVVGVLLEVGAGFLREAVRHPAIIAARRDGRGRRRLAEGR